MTTSDPSPPSSRRYQRKPTQIEAIQFTGDNYQELWDAFGQVGIIKTSSGELVLRTAQGQKVIVTAGEWVAKDFREGTFYPIDDEVFEKLYDKVDE